MFKLGPRRGKFIDITKEEGIQDEWYLNAEIEAFETFDLIYRSLCTILYNYAPTSGHPGGSISSGRLVAGIIFGMLDYDVSNPDREDADIISYAAGHKALGMYSMWALRNEIIRLGAPELLPKDLKYQLRLEDLLGFRRNAVSNTPLSQRFASKSLDGHPTQATPFLRISTGASGVGVASSIGLALAAMDYYGKDAPYVHIIEGEGGMTAGRVGEALAAAGTARLKNTILHIDWNQASIDSDRVCREDDVPGDYVQWNPAELCFLNDWNVILVTDGHDFKQIFPAQRIARNIDNGQPTAIVYRTMKGWQYGIEGRFSHGAGHSLCAEDFYKALQPLIYLTNGKFPCCEPERQRCRGGKDRFIIEACFWESLKIIRSIVESDCQTIDVLARRLVNALVRLNRAKRRSRENSPVIHAIFEAAQQSAGTIPAELKLKPEETTTLSWQLGRVLNYLNQVSKGAVLTAAADLLNSTNMLEAAEGFAEGYFNAIENPEARIFAAGGICEDAISGIISGISSFGRHIGVGSSYSAFMAPLSHIAARMHCIGNQAKKLIFQEPFHPMILVCAHAGLTTGKDGPSHADVQTLQLFQDNFPLGTMITLTPWDAQEIWPLFSAAISFKPAVIAPFVTRPLEKVINRQAYGLAPATDAVHGVYLLYRAKNKSNGTIVLQGSEVTYVFIRETLPILKTKHIELDVYYVSSSELFQLLPPGQQEKIFPQSRAKVAMGITGFTSPTINRWIMSEHGRRHTLYPFQYGHYLGSDEPEYVLKEAGLDVEAQLRMIMQYVKEQH